jgi:hypothetical protein
VLSGPTAQTSGGKQLGPVLVIPKSVVESDRYGNNLQANVGLLNLDIKKKSSVKIKPLCVIFALHPLFEFLPIHCCCT